MSKFERIRSRLGYHVVYDKSIVDAINFASKNGFAFIQIDLAMPKFFPEKYDQNARKEIREYAERKKIDLTLHVSGEDFSLQTLHSRIRFAIIDRIKEFMDFAQDIHAIRITIHLGTIPVFTMPGKGDVQISEQYPDLHREVLEGTLRELSSYAKEKTVLCVENALFNKIVMEVLDTLFLKEGVFLTWDIAKTYRQDGSLIVEVEDFFLKHLDKVRECHLHDRTEKGSHEILGRGKIDFIRYLNLLGDWNIDYTIEVRPRERALTCLRIIEGFRGKII
jgi:sugar phosphate isomerase/epimerase